MIIVDDAWNAFSRYRALLLSLISVSVSLLLSFSDSLSHCSTLLLTCCFLIRVGVSLKSYQRNSSFILNEFLKHSLTNKCCSVGFFIVCVVTVFIFIVRHTKKPFSNWWFLCVICQKPLPQKGIKFLLPSTTIHMYTQKKTIIITDTFTHDHSRTHTHTCRPNDQLLMKCSRALTLNWKPKTKSKVIFGIWSKEKIKSLWYSY